MKPIPFRTVEEVKEADLYKGELKEFIEYHSGRTLVCERCEHEIDIDEDRFEINLYVSDSIIEKVKNILGSEARRKGPNGTVPDDLRISDEAVAFAKIECPDCLMGYSSHDKSWKDQLKEE